MGADADRNAPAAAVEKIPVSVDGALHREAAATATEHSGEERRVASWRRCRLKLRRLPLPARYERFMRFQVHKRALAAVAGLAEIDAIFDDDLGRSKRPNMTRGLRGDDVEP